MSVTNLLAVATSTSDSRYTTGSSVNPDQVLGVLGAMLGFIIVILLLALVFVIARGKVFEKAGQPFWATFMPGYSDVLSFAIASKPGWWALIVVYAYFLIIIPLLGALLYLIILIVLYVMQSLSLARNFGKSGVFGFFLLFLLPFIGYPILGFGGARYNDGLGADASPLPASSGDKPEVFSSNEPQGENQDNNNPQNPPLVQ